MVLQNSVQVVRSRELWFPTVIPNPGIKSPSVGCVENATVRHVITPRLCVINAGKWATLEESVPSRLQDYVGLLPRPPREKGLIERVIVDKEEELRQ